MNVHLTGQRLALAGSVIAMLLGGVACHRPADASPEALRASPPSSPGSATSSVVAPSPPRRDPWAAATQQTTRSRDRITFTQSTGLVNHWGADATHLYFSDDAEHVIHRVSLAGSRSRVAEDWLEGSTFVALETHDVVAEDDAQRTRVKRNKVSKQLVPFPGPVSACDRWAEGASQILCVHDANLGTPKPGSIVLYNRKNSTSQTVDTVTEKRRIDDVLWHDGRFYFAESGGLREVNAAGALRIVAPLGHGTWKLKTFLGAIVVADLMSPTTTVSFYSPQSGKMTARPVNLPRLVDIAADENTLYVLGDQALVAWHAAGAEERLELTHHGLTEAAPEPNLLVTPTYVLWQRSPAPPAGARLREFNLVGVRR